MNHIALGAATAFAAGCIVYAIRGFRASPTLLVTVPLLMALGALWAVVPDLPRIAGDPGLYERLAQDPWSDLFLWHHTIDAVEGDAPWPAAAIVLMLAALLAAAWRELARAERESPWPIRRFTSRSG